MNNGGDLRFVNCTVTDDWNRRRATITIHQLERFLLSAEALSAQCFLRFAIIHVDDTQLLYDWDQR